MEEVEITGELQEMVERSYVKWCKEVGVPTERLRLYAPIKIPNGWHACVAYQREFDDGWVWMEWTRKFSGPLVEERRTIGEVPRYAPYGTYLKVTSLNPFHMVICRPQK